MKNVFEEQGDLRGVDPLAGLVTCWREKTRGALRFSRGTAECGFDLDEGEVVAVVSSDPRFETAAILVRAGKLAADVVDRLAPQGGDAALTALQTGLLTRREWKWGEKIRAIEVLSDLLSWDDGSYRLDAGASVHSGDFRLPVPRMLLELFLRSRDRSLIDHQIGPPEQTLVKGERFEVEFPSFGLTADAESVVRLIDGRSTAAQIAEKAPAEEFAVRKLLAALVTLGLVHPVPTRPLERSSDRATEPELSPFPEAAPASEEAAPASEEVSAAAGLPPAFEIEQRTELPDPEPEAESAIERIEAAADSVDLPESPESPLDRFVPTREPVRWDPEPEAERQPEPGGLWETTPSVESDETVPEAPPKRGGAPLAWGLGLLLAAVAVVLWWKGRETVSVPKAAPAVPTAAVPAVTFPPPVTASRAEPTRGVPTPALQPTARPAAPSANLAPRPSAVPAAPEPAAGQAPSGARATWDRRAQRDRRRLDGERATRYAIQLELVCEVSSLDEAWKYDRGEAMWLLAVDHAGRPCYRVLWGRYPSLDAAKRAKQGIPSYFLTPRNRPAVVLVR